MATAPLGWRCVGVAEVKPFPCAVLAHHYPDVPNLGDVEADGLLDAYMALRPDVLIAGPPCQDYSVAGLRAGIHGDRGNLTFRWAEIIHAARPRFALTENVPGWLTANDGLAFGAFLAGLVGDDTPLLPPKLAGGRWTNAGMVDGPLGRAAWRILDARYFDLAQRRERVFVVWCPANGGDPAQVLLESQGVRGDFAASGSEAEGIAGTLEASIGRSRGAGVSHAMIAFDSLAAGNTGFSIGDRPGALHGAGKHGARAAVAYGCNNTSGPIDVAGALNASHTASGRQDFETETFIAHTLKGEGFDASEDGTGRGVPLVVADSPDISHSVRHGQAPETDTIEALRAMRSAVDPQTLSEWGLGVLAAFWPAEVLRSGLYGASLRRPPQPERGLVNVALSRAQIGQSWTVRDLWQAGCDGCPPQGFRPSEQLAGELGAYLSQLPQSPSPAERFMHHLWCAYEGSGFLRETLSTVQKIRRSACVQEKSAHTYCVRRLVPEEAEALQGFPRGYTLIPYRGKIAADGPRYEALGNSMAVPVLKWICSRIARQL